jgi:hypothetical protein
MNAARLNQEEGNSLTLKTWSPGPSQSAEADFRNQTPRGTGIMECWNTEVPRLAK